MLKLLVFVSISAKLVAFAWASEQEVACTEQSTVFYYNDFLPSMLNDMYPGIDDETVDGVSRFYGANDADNGICLYSTIRTVGKKNILTSLYALLFQLSQLASCADESMRTQILNVMNMNSMEEADKLMPYETKYFDVDVPNNYSSTMDYLIMTDNKHQCTDDFKNRYSSLIRGQTEITDFGDCSTTADYFNNWMKQDSCDLDYDFLSSEQTLDKSGLIMASKNHFTVYWDKSCRPLKTVSMEFYESDGNVVNTDALYFEGYARYNYDEYLKATVLEIPLAGDYKLRIIHPQDKTKMEETIFRMRSPEIYRRTFTSPQWTPVKLTIPLKQETCGSEDFVPGLKMANLMTDAFHSEANVFSSGFEDGTGVHVSHIFHTIRLSFKDLEDEEMDSEFCEDSDSVKVVEVNSPYAFDIICFADTRMFSGVMQVAD